MNIVSNSLRVKAPERFWFWPCVVEMLTIASNSLSAVVSIIARLNSATLTIRSIITLLVRLRRVYAGYSVLTKERYDISPSYSSSARLRLVMSIAVAMAFVTLPPFCSIIL